MNTCSICSFLTEDRCVVLKIDVDNPDTFFCAAGSFHGTNSLYQKCVKRPEGSCAACREAAADYHRAYRQRGPVDPFAELLGFE